MHKKIFNTNINTFFKKWLTNYLSGRHGYIENNDKLQSEKKTQTVFYKDQSFYLQYTIFLLRDIPESNHPEAFILSHVDSTETFS